MAFAEQLDEVVERIIDQAIEFFMFAHDWHLNFEGNYEQSMGSDGVQITPPGKPVRTSGGQVIGPGFSGYYDGFEYGAGANAGSLVYGHFETTIREMFRPWKTIPTPSDFDPYLDNFREAAWSVALTSEGNKVSGVGNDQLEAVRFLQSRISGMSGDMILTFDQNFCTPLPTVVHGQYAVALLAGTTLCGEKEIWVKAREDVLKIADKTYEAMKERGASVEDDLGTITALFGIAAVFPTPAQPILAGVASVLPALESLIKAGDEPGKQPVEFAGGTPEKVLGKTQEALKKLAQTIRAGEDDLKTKITDAIELVTSRSGSFDMPKPKLLEQTEIGGMKVDLETLGFLATSTLPQIARQLYIGADETSWGARCSHEWYRTTEIGASDSEYGPREAWSALASLAEDLMTDLAWETKECAAHLEIASHRIGQTEAEVEAALRRHGAKLGHGSGRDPIGEAGKWLTENR
jgi:hypothetical protein